MKKFGLSVILMALILITMACSIGGKKNNKANNASGNSTVLSDSGGNDARLSNSGENTDSSQPSNTSTKDMVSLSQWASSAIASSEYGSDNWAANQATGKPDTTECGDEVTAWASSASNGIDWLELQYDTAVVPTTINIFQTYNPSQVTEVILYDAKGASYSIYKANPKKISDCPYTLTIPVNEAKYETQRIRIMLDQSVLSTSWNEIDAVELVGMASPDTLSEQGSLQADNQGSSDPETSVSDAPRFFYDELDGPLSDLWVDTVFYYIPDGMEEDDPDAEPRYTIEQERGRLKFYLETPWQYVYYFYSPQTYRNVRIDYEIENKGVNTNNVGLVCRYTDYGYYEFIATSGGYYSIMRYYEDGDKELATGGIKSIRFGTEKKNTFTAICNEEYLYFIVNDVEIAKVHDDEISEGMVGINVSAEDVVPVQIEFNWIEISEP